MSVSTPPLRRWKLLAVTCLLLSSPGSVLASPKKIRVPDPTLITQVSDSGIATECWNNGGTLFSGRSSVKKKKVYFLTYDAVLQEAAKKLRKAKPKKIPKAQAAYDAALAQATTMNAICRGGSLSPDASMKPASTGAASAADIRYLLDKIAYGEDYATYELVGNPQGLPMSAIIDQLFAIKPEDTGFIEQANDRLDERRGVANTQGSLTFRGQRQAWMHRQLDTRNPFYYRLHQCYLGIWTTGANVLTEQSNLTPLWNDYSEMLLNAAASDRALPDVVIDVARSPMMLSYLNNGDNIRGKPNENFARELMELFTIGVDGLSEVNGVAVNDPAKPNYVEFRLASDGNQDQSLGDVRTVARRLTGFRLSQLRGADGTLQWRGVYSAADHEPGPELMFAGTPNEFLADNDEDVIRGIFARHSAAPEYLALQLIRCFGTERPSLGLVKSVARELVKNGWRVHPTLKTYFASTAFFHERYRRTLTMPPDTLAIKFIRTLNMNPQTRWDQANPNNEFGVNIPNLVDRLYQRLGYGLNEPESVFWYFTDTFVSPGALLNLSNLYDTLITDSTSQNRIGWNVMSLFPVGTLTGDQAVRFVAARLNVPLTEDQIATFAFYLNNDMNSNNTTTARPFEGRTTASQTSKIRTLATLISMLPANSLK